MLFSQRNVHIQILGAMQHYKEYFTFLQQFDLRLVQTKDRRVVSKDAPAYGMGYDIRHQNPYFSFQFSNQLRILKDLAFIDIISADNARRIIFTDQIKKIFAQFKRFWDNYFIHDPTADETLQSSYLLINEFGKIFYTNILEPDKRDVIVSLEFIEDLCDSIREREESLAEFIREIDAVENKGHKDADVRQETKDEIDPVLIRRHPVLIDDIVVQFFKIFGAYFDDKLRDALFSLLKNNISPKKKLLFNSNGNQLADAFKQLIETGLIVSCNKAELESWIISHFQYISNSQAKSFTAGYLNSIISSDVKICKSPILAVKKNGEKGMVLVPVFRNKRGSDS